ncbi:calcineurin-binding protein cabin-1-like isoform X2 [Onthophagus taurus]|uniref:calcineurin-binding protein cabin-1-like isoform X2 n=1 Tax=Onthophagus taurus TaxID=166361 RepID=UPI0039BE6197
MSKIHALNRESSSDEDGPTIRKEALEEITLDMYNKALRIQSCGDYIAAEDILQTLLNENIPQLEIQGGLPKTMSTIKYSCYVNLGAIAIKQKKLSEALKNYLGASELDSTDVTLWFKIGKLAMKLDKFKLASHAFSKGLECSESHWPCLDNLISVLFALRDTIACLMYIGKALILDPDYKKGLVFRKNIYDCNPATKDYYQLYNPDYIYEPSLDLPVNIIDEQKYLDEVQLICDRINEVEKSLAPKPLPIIPLPKPLEESSWLALGQTLTELHKYISENDMSHFSQIDLKRCMSQNVPKAFSFEVMTVQEENQPLRSEETEEKSDKTEDEALNSEKTETGGDIMERRLSQISEANTVNDLEMNTPVQTDNDEMDQDPDETEENSEQKSEKKRGTKRRRDLVSELQIWGWHSKRKYAKKGKTEKDFTIEDALKRIIPRFLLPNGIDGTKYNPLEDSMNTMDMYMKHMSKEAVSLMSAPNSPQVQPVDPYFGSENEKDDVQAFWTQPWRCCDSVNLIEAYVYAVSRLWHLKWPSGLISLYLDAYNMFREHIEHPKLYDSDITFEEFQNDALATLTYGELIIYNDVQNTNYSKIHYSSLDYMETVGIWEENWGSDYKSYWCRVNWLRTHIYRKANQNVLSIIALQSISDVIENESNSNFKICLPNCIKYGYIMESIIHKLLRNLEMIDSLTQLEKLFDSQKYAEVAEILKLTFNISNPPTYGRMGRPAQLGMLLHSLWYTDLENCFVWSEECLHESLKYFIKPTSDGDKWEMILNKCILIMIEIIKKETISVVDNLTVEKRARLVESLAMICCRQINVENGGKLLLGTLSPWMLLHYVLVREEHRLQAKKVVKHVKKDDDKSSKSEAIEEDIPPSIAVLFSGHEFLGGKSLCLADQGEFLHFILDTVIDRLDTPIFEPLREKIDIHLEQAFFCLYQHPSKKNKVSRHLADHNVTPLPLTWEKAQQVYEFFCPDALPEFDSYKSISISAELEQLLQRISSLVPTECDPQPLVLKVTDFVKGNIDSIPKPVDFPIKTRSMYYLLGDYYFKQSEVKRSYKYFILDLCINPSRVDTWACLALGIASQLESKLNHCERFKSEMEFLDKAQSAQVCFKQALSVSNEHITLWIEYGSLEYMIHSFCSRVLKYDSETLSMERFDTLENKKDTLLESSGSSFLRALQLPQPDLCDIDERWLYHYMLGKIAQKRQKEPSEYLQHYLTAMAFLHENKATYPEKINYTNPQHLSIEALEIHYRIHASILKYLELHEGKPIPETIGKMFNQCLEAASMPKAGEKVFIESETPNTTLTCDPISSTIKPITEEKKDRTENKDDLTGDVKKCMDDMLNQLEKDNENNSISENKKKQDVIVLDDSDEDLFNMRDETEKKRDVQEIMEEMMKATMEKQNENNDDSDITVQEVTISPQTTKEVKSDSKEIKDSSSERSDENIRKSTEGSSSTSSSSSDSDSSDSDSDDSSSSSSSSSSENNGNLSENDILSLIDLCICGLEECIRRLPQNYKAIYRLGHLYFHCAKRKDLIKCRQLFLGEYKCQNGAIVTGLFSERKANNFFNGVWRIPSSEIDRPGSLAAHMGRCVTLLLQILYDTNDHKTLLDMCLQLRKVPDADKIYIRHVEREQLSEQALTLCIQSLRKQIKNIENSSSSMVQKILLDVYRIYQRSQKSLPNKESTFASMLTDVYKKCVKEKVPENANLLDLAIKFCAQSKAIEKIQKQQTQVVAPKPIPVQPPPSVPVLPTPTTILPPSNQQLKRPGLGRPRGRPPGPKSSTQQKPRARNPTSLQWPKAFDPSAYGYLQHYQEELIKQYSQTLSLTQQMNQIGSLYPQANQNNLLSSLNFLQSMQQLSGGMNPLLLTQAIQGLNQFQNVNKNIADLYKLPTSIPPTNQLSGLLPEQMRLLAAMSQSSLLPSSTQVPTTSNTVSTSSKSTYPITKPSSVSITKTVTTKSNTPTFKYPTEVSKPKQKEITKTTSSYHSVSKESYSKSSKPSTITSKDLEKSSAANILKDRPNISITPVTQPITSISVTKSVSSGHKTLQEKLADKQKQRKIDASNKVMEKVNFPSTSIKVSPIANLTLPPSINVYPTFPKESGVSIAQVSVQKSGKSEVSISAIRPENVQKHKLPASETPPKVGLSVRKIEELRERKPSSDEDIILIE